MKKTSSMIAATLLLLLASASLLGACNTMAGAGKDISKTGDALEKSAEKHAP